TEHHFVSWLRLCPDNRISGERIIGKGRLPTNNRVTTALKIAGQQPTSKQYLSGSAVPPIKNQAGCSHRDQGHGRQAGPLGLPHTALRDEIRGSRSRVLRGSTPADPDYASQMEGRQAGIQSHRSSGSLATSFWGVSSDGDNLDSALPKPFLEFGPGETARQALTRSSAPRHTAKAKSRGELADTPCNQESRHKLPRAKANSGQGPSKLRVNVPDPTITRGGGCRNCSPGRW